MLCSRCRRAEALDGKRSCRACHDYNVRRSRYLSVTSAVGEQQTLYAMRTLAGHLKVGRSNDVHKRSAALGGRHSSLAGPGAPRAVGPSASRRFPGLAGNLRLPPRGCGVRGRTCHGARPLHKGFERSSSNELRRWRSDANAGASSEPARPDATDSPDIGAGFVCSSGAGSASSGETSAKASEESEGEGRTACAPSVSLTPESTQEDAREA